MISTVASLDHYRDHLDPIVRALPAEVVEVLPDATLVAAWRDLRTVRPRRSDLRRRIALVEHGIGQSYSNRHPSYPGGRDRDAVGLFLSPNNRAGDADRAAYPSARVEVVGSPRLDGLSRRVGAPGRVVATTFHWDSHVAPETRSAFAEYAAAIVEVARRFEVVGTAHPRIARELGAWYASVGIPFVPAFEEICLRADVLVADNTSALYEFASTGRPVVVLNASTYRRDVAHGLRFWEAVPGRQVDKPEDLGDAIDQTLELRVEDVAAREAALDIAYAYRGGAARRAAAAIVDWLL